MERVTLKWFADGPAYEYIDDSLGIAERIYVFGYPKLDLINEAGESERGDRRLQRRQLKALLASQSRLESRIARRPLIDQLGDLLAEAHSILLRWRVRATMECLRRHFKPR